MVCDTKLQLLTLPVTWSSVTAKLHLPANIPGNISNCTGHCKNSEDHLYYVTVVSTRRHFWKVSFQGAT